MPIYELDWHESMEYSRTTTAGDGDSAAESSPSSPPPLSVMSVLMRHCLNCSGGDHDEMLWCSYSITAGSRKFLFLGDTAWFDGLEDLAEQHSPWDVAAIPVGAYELQEFMKYNHLDIEEAVNMKDVVHAKAAVPIYWGMFPLTMEPVLELREKLVELMGGRPNLKMFVPWLIGETKLF